MTSGAVGGAPRASIAPRFGRSSYRFTYQRFHSGDSSPPKLKVCNFEVIAP